MASCDGCGETVVFLRLSDGRWFPPVEPCTDFADGEYVTAVAGDYVQAMPQVYRRHRCPTPLSMEERAARAAARQRESEEREAERRELIRLDRERRAREAEEAERHAREVEERRQAQEFERQKQKGYAYAKDNFKPKRLLDVPCRDCGQPTGEPCLNLRDKYVNGWFFYNSTPHNSRFMDGPPAKAREHPARWGDDYKGPWPPKVEDPGYMHMRGWLANNFEIFDPDGYQEREWLVPAEVITLTQWLRTNAGLFEHEEVHDDDEAEGPEGAAQPDREPGPEGVR